ncbi:MAG: Crp/Fnr family transcriptional regulator [Clostridiales bacterium]|nr:Crp/Fnr family transcriptional regulator [Clostridiales bacterium]
MTKVSQTGILLKVYHMIHFEVLYMDKSLLQSLFLFRGLDRERVKMWLEDERIFERSFERGETVSPSAQYLPCLGLIVKGTVRIEKKADHKSVPLRQMQKGGVFGAASLFGGDAYVTVITARAQSSVVFLPQDYVKDLLLSEPLAAMNYILFLSEKVRYLNEKIDFFTAGGTKDKVYEYLLRQADENGTVRLRLSLKELSEQLNMGRASLYRAVDDLIENGKILKTENGFQIINIE